MTPNRILHSAAILLPLASAALVASCDDPSSPELVQSWTLESLYGAEPPVLIFHAEHPDEPGVDCSHTLVSSEIELRTERHLDRIEALSRTCEGGAPLPYTETRQGTWTMEGDSLFLRIETGDPILPEAPLDGRVAGDRLFFEFEVFSEGGGVDTVAIVYRRVI